MTPVHRFSMRALLAGGLAALCAVPAAAGVVGSTVPSSFSVCERATDANEVPRPECTGSDVRFQAGEGSFAGTEFGFSVASGFLNADDEEDLVVGDPARNRVYVFLGRRSVEAGYGLDPAQLADREVSAESGADFVLTAPPEFAGFGFSVAVGRQRVANACASQGRAAALAIGAPGRLGTAPDPPGTAFYVPPGTFCGAPATPPAAAAIAVLTVGQAVRAPVIEDDDAFGYSVGLGRLLTTTGEREDIVVGAPDSSGGDGRVIAFPVSGAAVLTGATQVVEFVGGAGDGLGETMAVGDLDQDFDATLDPFGATDDLAVGAVGSETGKVLVLRGPFSPTGGPDDDGIYSEGQGDPRIKALLGEEPGDAFGFSVATSAEGSLAVGAIHADNTPPGSPDAPGGSAATNVAGGRRINAGKAYVWEAGLFAATGDDIPATTADVVLVGRRSADELGFSVAFADLDDAGREDLAVAARREDGRGLRVDEIDRGTVYVVYDNTQLTSPVNLGQCTQPSDCTGVAGVDVLLFGGDRETDVPDEMGFAMAQGDLNGDGADELFVSSRAHKRVYAVTMLDSDDDRAFEGRNVRDADDDEDGDPDATDCRPTNSAIRHGATEIACNGIDENCSGAADDAPDADGDGFDTCPAGQAADCADNDANSYPGATEKCDGNNNACAGSVPFNERDIDDDHYVACTSWIDTQGDNPTIVGGDDCEPSRNDVFPGAAPHEANPGACRQDTDGDDWGDLTPPAGVTAGTDCNDDAATTFPGAAEAQSATACMSDADGDGYGRTSATTPVVAGSDCNDLDPRTFPGAVERCDGNDNTCAGTTPAGELDPDGDRYLACSGFSDTQGDNPNILGGDDCDPAGVDTFPGSAPLEPVPGLCRRDADHDDYGDLSPAAGIAPGSDCNDVSATTFPGAAAIDGPLNCMKDGDDDGYGDASAVLPVVAGNDCDDGDPAVFLGATEVPDDATDQDCNGNDTVTCHVDADEDGFGTPATVLSPDGDCTDTGEAATGTDCNDANPAIHPGVPDPPDDGVDQDCSGAGAITCFLDGDLDGFGTTAGTRVTAADGTCDADDAESANDDDCDDGDAFTFLGASERCDGNDNACAGSVPANERDGDGDTFVACSGWSDSQGDNPAISGGGDCDDALTTAYPGAAEREIPATACRKDQDGDGFGDLAPPAGITPGSDCDDSSPAAASTFPGAAPLDNALTCMRDVDGDDRGDAGAGLPVVRGTDCDDRDPSTFPGALQRCDGDDNSCAGSVPVSETDQDGDGFVACSGWSDTQGDDPSIAGGGDCDDASASTFPGAAELEPVPAACRLDADGDGFGDLTPPPGVTAGTDCDDESPTAAVTFPGAALLDAPLNCMKDADGDDWGDRAVLLPVVRGRDCDDDAPAINPGADEGPFGGPLCSDGLDNDCDSLVDAADPVCAGPLSPCPDADTDGFADCSTDPNCDDTGLVCGDCNDSSGAIRPGAVEVCDQLDNDCDGAGDEDFDADGDGFTTCDLPVSDCNDGNIAVNPAAAEACGDGVDNDCNAASPDLFDADGDGAVCNADCDDANAALNLVDADSDSVSTCAGDCNDANAAVRPGLPETCNDGVDNDCNAATSDVFDGDSDGALCTVDCDDQNPLLNLADADTDTFTTCAGDCDDQNALVHPGAIELCDQIDNNCDGTRDDTFDVDGDGYTTCSLPVPDCNDGNALVSPGAPEVCDDGADNDCNPATTDVRDADGDGVACTLDCNDADPASYPGATEACDGDDNDCDGTVPPDERDLDGDHRAACGGWNDTQGDDAIIAGGDDCDDADPLAFPGAAPNEPVPGACTRDADGDGFGDIAPPPGITAGSDCDDTGPDAASTFPGAAVIDGPLNCMKDADGDDYGDAAVFLPVVPGTDCDDGRAQVSPGASETSAVTAACSDTLDNDCDGFVDAADAGCVSSLRPTGRGSSGAQRAKPIRGPRAVRSYRR